MPAAFPAPLVIGAGAAVAAPAGYLAYRGAARAVERPGLLLRVFCWLLPVHVLVIAVLYGGLGMPGAVVRVVAAWKEMAVLAAVAVTGLRAVARPGTPAPVVWTDLAVLAAITWAAAFVVGEGPLLGAEVSWVSCLYGARDSSFFMLLYVVGRATPEVGEDGALLRTLAFVGGLTAAAALVERALVSPDLLVALGAALYFRDFLGATAVTEGNDFGLPDNYWSEVGHHMVRRVGSVYLSSQSFAVASLLVVPAVSVLLFRRGRHARLLFALAWAGLLLTITRATIAICAAQVLVLALLYRRLRFATGAVAGAAAAFVAALLAVPGLPTFVWQTLNWSSGSSVSHANTARTALAALASRPLGSGLGTGDLAVRLGGRALSGDNMYLKYAVEQGVLGVLPQAAALIGIAAAGLALFARGEGEERRAFGAVTFAAAIGVALNGLTTLPYGTPMLAYVFFWMGGTAVTLAERTRGARAAYAAPAAAAHGAA